MDEEGRDARRSRTRRRTRCSISTSITQAACSTSRSRCTVTLGGQVVDEFTLQPKQPRAAEDSAQGGAARHRRRGRARDFGRQDVRARRCWSPASKDPRELGVRVFHAFVDPQIDDESDMLTRRSPPSCSSLLARRAGARGARVFRHRPHDVGEGASRRRRLAGARRCAAAARWSCDASIVARFAPDEVPYPEPDVEAPAAPAPADAAADRPVPYSDDHRPRRRRSRTCRRKLVRAVIQVESAYQRRAPGRRRARWA